MHERRRARALCCVGYGGGEVAAAELGWGGVARGGGLQREGRRVQRLRRCHVRQRAKQEVACRPSLSGDGAALRRR